MKTRSATLVPSAPELLLELRRRGAEVEVTEDGRLRVRAPKGAISGQLRAALGARKNDLLRLLSRDAPRCQGCGAEVLHRATRFCQDCVWDDVRAERALKSTIDRAAEIYQEAGCPEIGDPDPLAPHERAIDKAFRAQDMPALRKALEAFLDAMNRLCAAGGGGRLA